MSSKRLRRAGLFATLSLAFVPNAMGQSAKPLAPDPVAAELFRAGRDLIEQGKWTEGCAKLELSMKRFPAASTLLNLANCAERQGQVASAWAMNRRALVLNRETPGQRRRSALEEVGKAAIERLEPKLPYLQVVLPNPPHDAEAREGDRVLPLNTPVPLDPGTVRVTVSASGYNTWRSTVTLSMAEDKTVRVMLVRAAPETVVSPDVEPSKRGHVVHDGGIPAWAWISTGAGVVFSGVAAGFAFDAKATHDDLVELCGEDLTCNEAPDYDPGPKNARKNRDIGLAVGFGIVGVAALGVGLGGIFSNVSSSAEKEPLSVGGWVTEQGGGLQLQRSF